MIQDIQPSVFSNAFDTTPPADDDMVFAFDGRTFMARDDGGRLMLPNAAEFWNEGRNSAWCPIRLFSIDDRAFYLAFREESAADGVLGGAPGSAASDAAAPDTATPDGAPYAAAPSTSPAVDGYNWVENEAIRFADPFPLRLAAATAWQLSVWYETSRFCGRCGHVMERDCNERALVCPACGNRVYPRINPAVIVAVRDGDRLLMTRYAGPGAYRHRALIAGFCEIGETAEQTVAREVLEEAGVHVKNIRYYKSQPWGFASDLLLGFVCDLDGGSELHMDAQELSSAEWVARADIYEEDDQVSLTREMILAFKNGLL